MTNTQVQVRSESQRLCAVDCAKSECSARASVEEYDPTPVRDSRPLTRRARPTLTAAQLNAGKAAARMQHMPGRAEKRMVRWAERKVGTKIYRRPSSTACKHSEGSNDTQVELQPQQPSSIDPASLYTFKSGTVSRRKEMIDHGRGMAATPLRAVVCCRIKCKHQRSRNSRATAVTFGFASPAATLLYLNLGAHSLLMY